MKYIIPLLFATIITVALVALRKPNLQQTRKGAVVENEAETIERHKALNPKQQERIARRAARTEAYIRFIDSVIVSGNYQFLPSSFAREPAGRAYPIYNIQYELVVQTNFTEIYLPYIKGVTPPYRMSVINTILPQVDNYRASQTDEGWQISFSSWLYSINNYNFLLTVYSRSGSAQLNITNSLYNQVTYWGSIMAVY